MAKRATVPKFGAWDSDNVGYTVYFDKVRENKGATAPPLQRPYNPNDPQEGPMMSVPGPTSRPGTAGGGHWRAGSSSSAASEPGGGGRGAEQSKFAPPPQYYQRPSPQPQPAQQQHQGVGGGHHHAPPPTGHGHGGGGGGGDRDRHAEPAPRARSASPQNNAPGRQRPEAVPKFGVWDEQSASAAAQGFTVQFENVKRNRDVARKAVPAVPQAPPPPPPRRSHHRDHPFFSKMFGCFIPNAKK